MDGKSSRARRVLRRALQASRTAKAPIGWPAVKYRIRNGLMLSLYATACACSQADSPEAAGSVVSNPTAMSATAPPVLPAPPRVSVSGPGTPCAQLAAIDEFPLKYGAPMTDPDYLALKRSGRAAIPCLVEEVASAAPMATPQSSPAGGAFTVGDMAFFLLVDFGYVDFLQALPPEVQSVVSSRGAFAYFDWIGAPGNRERLRARVEAQVQAGEAVAARAP
jgi:hypothetical protein